jgi:hypothetical protein
MNFIGMRQGIASRGPGPQSPISLVTYTLDLSKLVVGSDNALSTAAIGGLITSISMSSAATSQISGGNFVITANTVNLNGPISAADINDGGSNIVAVSGNLFGTASAFPLSLNIDSACTGIIKITVAVVNI